VFAVKPTPPALLLQPPALLTVTVFAARPLLPPIWAPDAELIHDLQREKYFRRRSANEAPRRTRLVNDRDAQLGRLRDLPQREPARPQLGHPRRHLIGAHRSKRRLRPIRQPLSLRPSTPACVSDAGLSVPKSEQVCASHDPPRSRSIGVDQFSRKEFRSEWTRRGHVARGSLKSAWLNQSWGVVLSSAKSSAGPVGGAG
jgi:hypothetical protein